MIDAADSIAAGTAIQTTNLGEAKGLARGLDRSYLFIQGPPGTGKTWRGARLILDLLGAAKRVGVTAQSHKVIHKLLGEISKAAREAGRRTSDGRKRLNTNQTRSTRTTSSPVTSTMPEPRRRRSNIF